MSVYSLFLHFVLHVCLALFKADGNGNVGEPTISTEYSALDNAQTLMICDGSYWLELPLVDCVDCRSDDAS